MVICWWNPDLSVPPNTSRLYIYIYPIATTTWCNSNDLPSYISRIVQSMLFSILTGISLEYIYIYILSIWLRYQAILSDPNTLSTWISLILIEIWIWGTHTHIYIYILIVLLLLLFIIIIIYIYIIHSKCAYIYTYVYTCVYIYYNICHSIYIYIVFQK